MIRAPSYNPGKDGNVFRWVLRATETYRELRKVESNATKEASAKLKKLDRTEMAYQKW